MSEHNDPEASYRRGYQQGAADALKALQAIPSRKRAMLLLSEWVEIVLFEWRYRDRTTDRTVHPPAPPSA